MTCQLELIRRAYYKRARWAAFVLRLVPFVRMVGLNGSMVRGQFHQSSDIDFLIITAKNRIFTARALVTLAIWLIGLKRSETKIAGRICLNRWATVEKLEITPHNRYHAWTFANLVPLFAFHSVYQLYQSSNTWMANFNYPVGNNKIILTEKSLATGWQQLVEKIIDWTVGDWLEARLKYWQIKRINRRCKQSKQRWHLVISDQELCFHPLNLEANG